MYTKIKHLNVVNWSSIPYDSLSPVLSSGINFLSL